MVQSDVQLAAHPPRISSRPAVTNSTAENTGPFVCERRLSTRADVHVWLARGPDGLAVLKLARSEAGFSALRREARALTAVAHPRLARMLDSDLERGWIALARAEGRPLHRWAEGRSPVDISGVLAQTVDAVAALHRAGIVHGDLKPQNVLVDEKDLPTVVDLGCATFAGEPKTATRGTPGYMAPEQLRNEPATTRSDVYGIGGLLYVALTGRLPFATEDPASLAYLPLVSLPESPSSLRPALSATLSHVVLALLARDPARRPTDLAKLSSILPKIASGPPGPAVIGMRRVRDALRQAVVGAADGECRIVVLHGPPGCGRRTLLTEAVEAARREGLLPLQAEADPAAAARALKNATKPVVLTLRSTASTLPFVHAVVAAGRPALLIIHADHPLPELPTALSLSPPPLTLEETQRLVDAFGATVAGAEAWWRTSFGHPQSLVALCRNAHEGDLSAPARRILFAVRQTGRASVLALAEELNISAHELIDHAEALWIAGLVTTDPTGRDLVAAGS